MWRIARIVVPGRRTKTIYAANSTTQPEGPGPRVYSYEYHPAGQLASVVKPNGVRIEYAYENRELLATRTYSTSQPEGWQQLGQDEFTYHPNGLLATAHGGLYNTDVNRNAENLADYDAANRLLSERQNIGAGAKTFTYTNDNLPDTVTYPSGTQVQQTYTNRRQLYAVNLAAPGEQQLNPQAWHEYDAAGRLTMRHRANNTETLREYDANSRVTHIAHQAAQGGQIFQSWTYAYSDEGNLLAQKDTTPNLAAWGEAYRYDQMNRLIDAKRGPVDADNNVPVLDILLRQQWNLTKVGDWEQWTKSQQGEQDVIETGEHNDLHSLTSRNIDQDPAKNLVHDLNGSQIDGNDVTRALYTYGHYIDEPLTMDRWNGESFMRYFYHQNRMFSTYVLTDFQGAVAERYAYTAYGECTTYDANYANPASWSRVGNAYTYTGRVYDPESDTMDYRRRTYLPRLGRMNQIDQAGFVDGMNLYQYTGNNPVVYVDPSGLWKVERKGQARADAEAEENNTPRILGTEISLSSSEFKKWMKLTGTTIKTMDGHKTLAQLEENTEICPKERVTVPNTGYIDVGSYTWGFLGWYLMGYKSELNNLWSNAGIRVVYTGKWSTTKDKILGHLGSDDIYKFAYIGHGAVGCMTGLSGGDGIICGDKYTPFGIAAMHIVACESNDDAGKWRNNVSKSGLLTTIKGIFTVFNKEFVRENGSR